MAVQSVKQADCLFGVLYRRFRAAAGTRTGYRGDGACVGEAGLPHEDALFGLGKPVWSHSLKLPITGNG